MRNLILLLLLGLLAQGCNKDSDCDENYVCPNKISCQHKGLFPLGGLEILGTILIFSCSVLSNAAGQGGGPLMTVILFVLFNYHPEMAIPTSQLIILGGAGIGFLLRIPMRHPTRPKPLIDYYSLLLFSPSLMLGTTIGVMLEIVFPSLLNIILLILILLYTSYTSVKMSIQIYRSEKAEDTEPSSSNLVVSEDGDRPTLNDESYVDSSDLARIMKSEARWFPLTPIFILLVIYLFFILEAFFRGGKWITSILGFKHCSTQYWIVTLLVFTVYLIFCLIAIWYNVYITRKKIKSNYIFDSHDIIWSWKPLTICTVSAIFAGLVASLLGFGGALILSPVMIKLGMRPEVVAGTSTAVIVLTSSISVIQFGIAGKLELYYGIWVISFSMIGSIAGVCFVKGLLVKYNRGSVVVIILAVLMVICTIILPVYGIFYFVANPEKSLGFNSYCNDN